MKPQIRIGLLTLLICSLVAAQTTQPTTAESSKFLLFVPDDNDGGKLEASVVTYRNDAGVTVDLVAAVHIADKSFFHGLQDSFTQYDSLLYEMVAPKDYVPGQTSTTHPMERPISISWVSTLQQFMKDQLQLSFQLEEIDYSKKNFVHADLDTDTFLDMQAQRGESLMGLMMQQMIHELASDKPAEDVGIGDLLTALAAPDRARQLKLMLAKDFSQMDDMMSGMDGPNGTVLVTERNKAALNVLKQRIAAGDKKIGIFYGAAHLRGMEKILTQEMGFTQVGEPKWRTAWDMTKPGGK